MEKVIIVGTGPAGLTAAIYLARANLKPLVLEGPQPGGQLTTTTDVENYPGFPDGIDGTTLVVKMREQAVRFGARVESGAVVSSDFQSRPLRLVRDDGGVLEALCVIIASGARAKYLGLESEHRLITRGVSGCATCDGALYRDVPVAVVGGGDTAMEDALFLTRFTSSVTLIHRRDEFRASPIMVDRVRAQPRIRILWNTVVDEVLDVARNEVTGLNLHDVRTDAKQHLPISALFLAIGHTPNTAAFRGQLAMNDQGYLIAENTRTGVAGVFAAGDVQDPVYKQAVTAAGSGCVAALEAARYLESLGH
jgi:thioredoxin reductase (NADPH)